MAKYLDWYLVELVGSIVTSLWVLCAAFLCFCANLDGPRPKVREQRQRQLA